MYTIPRTLSGTTFADVAARTRQALARAGFGIITEIDMQATMRAKLGAEIAPYLILGACNPRMALEALRLEPQVGAMLPCNVIVRDAGGGDIEVAAIDPVESMAAIDNPALKTVAGTVRDRLRDAVASI